ncbi:MAG: hypothetical protein A2Z20_06640 [Bdellovibrionales bacterium RBG_16_40_8]|nr:MAG: hypothetical protein A2Z20_06640 [Bdellovibrionales bacterium RBG_16_40_8]
MTMHRPIIAACESAIIAIFSEGRYAAKIVEIDLKRHKKWGSRDRRQYAESVYDVVRWWRLLIKLAGHDYSSFNVTLESVREILQIYFVWRKNPEKLPSDISELSLAERESIPDWLDRLGASELGQAWPLLLHALNMPAKTYLRVNNLKSSLIKLQNILHTEGIETNVVSAVPSALVLRERKNVLQTQAFKHGFFEIQDGGSQLIAPLLKVEPGMTVIDACAGAGGKTLHLADIMQNKGKIIALDVNEFKLKELRKRAIRAGVSIIETHVMTSQKDIECFLGTADRVLLDVPCSGLGVLRRNPDTKWKISEEEIKRLAKLQDEILLNYYGLLKPNGKLVYSTCSILPSENQKRIQSFMLKTKNIIALEEEIFISSAETQFDGFYGARLSVSK